MPFVMAWLALATVAPALPVAVGFGRLGSLSNGWRWLLAWLILALVLNLVMMGSALWGLENSMVTQLTLPVYGGLGLVALGELVAQDRWRTRLRILAGLFVIAWAVLGATLGLTSPYSLYAQPLMNLLFAAAGVVVAAVGLSRLPRVPLRDPMILAGLATLVTYAPTAAITPVASVVAATDVVLASRLYLVQAVFQIAGSLLFTLALLWIPPPVSSAGS